MTGKIMAKTKMQHSLNSTKITGVLSVAATICYV